MSLRKDLIKWIADLNPLLSLNMASSKSLQSAFISYTFSLESIVRNVYLSDLLLFVVCPPPPSYLLHYLYELCWLFVKKRRSLSLHDPGTNRISPSQIFSLDFKFYQTKSHSLEWQYFSVFTLPHRSSLNEGHKILAPPPQKNAKDPKCLNLKGNPAYMILAQLHTFLSKFSKRFVAYLRIQGLSDRMSFLKLLVLWTESTIGAQWENLDKKYTFLD